MGAELFGLLVALLVGEVWEAWRRLARFDPRTPARALRAMMTVMQPKKIKEVKEMQGSVEEWELKVKQLSTEHDFGIDDQIKVAFLTGMLPADFQDYVFQWSDGKIQFKEVKEKVLTLAMNRASISKPTPMEVDKVWVEEWYDEQTEEQLGNY